MGKPDVVSPTRLGCGLCEEGGVSVMLFDLIIVLVASLYLSAYGTYDARDDAKPHML